MNEFVRRKFDAIDGHTTVEFAEITTHGEDGFKIIVKPSGMSFKGTMYDSISSEGDLERFASLIGAAWSDHKKLSPRIVSSLSGH